MPLIKSIHISTTGVIGFSGPSSTIYADGDFISDLNALNEEDWEEHLQEIRKKIASAFEIIWGEEAKNISVLICLEPDSEKDECPVKDCEPSKEDFVFKECH